MASVTHDLVPHWLHVPFIQTGYVVPNYRTAWQAKWLLLDANNQTVNAWTIILSAFVSLGLYGWVVTKHNLTTEQFIVFTAFLLSCVVHAPFAVGNHILRHLGESAYAYWKRMDIFFIFVASIFLTFSLSYFLLPGAVTAILVGLSVLAASYAYHRADTRVYGLGSNTRRVSSLLCVMMAIIPYIIPVIYACFVRPDLRPIGLGIIGTLIFSGIIYATAFPERYYPRIFDLVGASHQIMHLGILVAHVLEFAFIYLLAFT